MIEQLKPCPFCGGVAKLFINNTDLTAKFGHVWSSSCHVGCQECFISQIGNHSISGEHVTPEQISSTIKEWNTRLGESNDRTA